MGICANAEHQSTFDRDGFVVVDLVDAADLDDFTSAAASLIPPSARPFFSLYRHDSPQLRRRIDSEFRPRLAAFADRVLVGQRPYLASILAKFDDEDGELHLHRDWSFVDESEALSGLIWLPLTPTGPDSGGLLVVPGSHRDAPSPRGVPAELPSEAERERLASGGEVVAVETRPGQAVIYDNRLLHGSTANRSGELRTVLALGFVPRDQPLLHHVTRDGRTTRLVVTDSFFVDYRPDRPEETPGVLDRLPMGSSAGWGRSLWLAITPSGLELAGDSERDPVGLGPDDVCHLLAHQRSGHMPSAMRPELGDALRARGVVGGTDEPPQDTPRTGPATHHLDWRWTAPVILRSVGTRIETWSRRDQGVIQLTGQALDLIALVADGSTSGPGAERSVSITADEASVARYLLDHGIMSGELRPLQPGPWPQDPAPSQPTPSLARRFLRILRAIRRRLGAGGP